MVCISKTFLDGTITYINIPRFTYFKLNTWKVFKIGSFFKINFLTIKQLCTANVPNNKNMLHYLNNDGVLIKYINNFKEFKPN